MKKRGIIIGVAVAILLAGGIFALTKYEPKKSNENQTESTSERISVLELADADDITVNSSDNKLHFIKQNDVWTIEGIASEDLSQDKINAFLNNALSYKSDSELEDGDLSEYGLLNPAVTIEIKSGKESHTVCIGDKSAFSNAYFASADGVLFSMPAAQKSMILNSAAFYTEFSRITINPDNVSEVRIERENGNIDVYIPEITKLEGNVWRMKEPFATLASDDYMDNSVLEQLGSITLSMKAENLGDVRAKLIIKTKDISYDLLIGAKDGIYTYVGYDGAVYSEASDLLSFVDAKPFEFVNKLVSYVHANDIESCTTSYNGIEHVINVSGKDSNIKYQKDGNAADDSESRTIYSEIIGIVATGLYNNEPLGDTLLKVSFKGRDGAANSVVEYKKINEYTAAVLKDGNAVFITGANDVEALKTKLDKYFNQGEQ